MFLWWYAKGWGGCATGLLNRLRDAFDFFSMSSLIRTLFAPFRQIAAGVSDTASMGERLRMFGDRLISRFVGATVRLIILAVGVVVIVFEVVIGSVLLVLWPLVPLFPVFGLILTIFGVMV